MGFEPATFGLKGLNAPSGAGCSLTPASGSRVIATFPGAGSPPACGGPSGGGWNGSIFTTFRWYDATRHRRPRERIRRRLWTRPCGKVAVRRGVPHHSDGDQDHNLGRAERRHRRQAAHGRRGGVRCSHGVARDGVSARLCDSSHLACDSRIDALPKEVPTRHWMKWAVAVQNVRVINVTHGPLIQVELRLIGKRTAQAREQVLIRDPLVF